MNPRSSSWTRIISQSDAFYMTPVTAPYACAMSPTFDSLQQYAPTRYEGGPDTSKCQTKHRKRWPELLTSALEGMPMSLRCMSDSHLGSCMSGAYPATARILGQIFRMQITWSPWTKMHWFSGRFWHAEYQGKNPLEWLWGLRLCKSPPRPLGQTSTPLHSCSAPHDEHQNLQTLRLWMTPAHLRVHGSQRKQR